MMIARALRRRIFRTVGGLTCLVALAVASPAEVGSIGSPEAPNRIDGIIGGGTFSLVKPDAWNGDLVLLVHGSIPGLFEAITQDLTTEGFGVAFATLPSALGDGSALKWVTTTTRTLQALFGAQFGRPDRVFLYSFSRGAHNAQQLVETSPARYHGWLSVCGGNGGSQLAWDYFFTARVLFDYYFPGVLSGHPLGTPPRDIDAFFAEVAPLISDAILANPAAASEMAKVDQYGLEYADFGELVAGLVQSLAIHHVGVNDLLLSANGNPFDNSQTVYTGTNDDAALNAGVARLSAAPQARNYLRTWYEPDGSIRGTPVLLLHTARDPFVPDRGGNSRYEQVVHDAGHADALLRRVIDRFGHCTFTPAELSAHFRDLVSWSETGGRPAP